MPQRSQPSSKMNGHSCNGYNGEGDTSLAPDISLVSKDIVMETDNPDELKVFTLEQFVTNNVIVKDEVQANDNFVMMNEIENFENSTVKKENAVSQGKCSEEESRESKDQEILIEPQPIKSDSGFSSKDIESSGRNKMELSSGQESGDDCSSLKNHNEEHGNEHSQANANPNKVGEDVLTLMSHLENVSFCNRISPTASTLETRNTTLAQVSTAGVAQKKAVAKKKTPETKVSQQNKPTTRESLKESPRRSDTPLAKRTSTTTTAKASTATTTKSANAKLEGATRKTTKNSSPTARVNNIFKSSPLAHGVSPDLTKLAKASPSHLIRPSSSIYRSTASSSSKTVGSSPALVKQTSPGSKQLKSSKSATSPSKATSVQSTINRPVRMGDSEGGSGEKASLKDQFAAFSKFGDSASDGKQITLSNCDKWMKQARVIDGKKITTTDTSILFKKLFKTAKKIGLDDFKKYAEELATQKKQEPKDIIEKLTNCGAPGTSAATKVVNTGVIDRLTDTSKYTGSHKERFDSAGKGRGIEGRRNVQDDSGYVAAFKEKKDEEKKKGESSSPTPAK